MTAATSSAFVDACANREQVSRPVQLDGDFRQVLSSLDVVTSAPQSTPARDGRGGSRHPRWKPATVASNDVVAARSNLEQVSRLFWFGGELLNANCFLDVMQSALARGGRVRKAPCKRLRVWRPVVRMQLSSHVTQQSARLNEPFSEARR